MAASHTAEYYAKWERYDVDRAEEEVEENAKVDERDRKLEKLEEKQAELEEASILGETLSSESFESRAAVEGLHKLRKGRKGRSSRTSSRGPQLQKQTITGHSKDDSMSEVDQPENVVCTISSPQGGKSASTTPPVASPRDGAVSDSLIMAEKASKRASHLKGAVESRNHGKRLAKDKEFQSALDVFQAGLQHLDCYEELLEPPAVETQEDDSSDKENPNVENKKTPTRSSKDICCGVDAERIKEQQKLLKPDPLQPDKDNLGITLRRDFNLNIGRSYLELGFFPEAADAFRYVLLVDGGNVSAWVARAECFRRMNLFTLADLHLVKATDIDDIDRNAKVVKTMNDKDLVMRKAQKILGDVDGGSTDPIEMVINSRKSCKEMLQTGIDMYKQAGVIFREQFFRTSGEKYESAINHFNAVEKITNVILPTAVSSLRLASCLGIAACCLLRKRELEKGERFCTFALTLTDGRSIPALLRRSECKREIGDWDGSVKDLEKALEIVMNGKARDGRDLAIADINRRLSKATYVRAQMSGTATPDFTS